MLCVVKHHNVVLYLEQVQKQRYNIWWNLPESSTGEQIESCCMTMLKLKLILIQQSGELASSLILLGGYNLFSSSMFSAKGILTLSIGMGLTLVSNLNWNME